MMISKSCFALSLFAVSASAFTPMSRQSTATKVAVPRKAIALDWEQQSQDDYDALLLSRAMDCAGSDTCSLEEAEQYLESILHAESGCASGALIGNQICDNVIDAAEAVANLREKVVRESRKLLAMNVSTSVVNTALALALVSAVVAGSLHMNPDVTPFTPQEWWWSIRDGYFPLMVQSYFRDGGFADTAGDSYSPETTPLAVQEWWWSIRDGYFPTMVEHYVKNGGLSIGEATEGGFASVPFTLQELSWAVKGGYIDQLLSDTYQSGGLSGVESGSEVVAFTPQEWTWAAQHGYLQQMAADYFRNGGL